MKKFYYGIEAKKQDGECYNIFIESHSAMFYDEEPAYELIGDDELIQIYTLTKRDFKKAVEKKRGIYR